jgi:hypothetical protein
LIVKLLSSRKVIQCQKKWVEDCEWYVGKDFEGYNQPLSRNKPGDRRNPQNISVSNPLEI